jgi:hypothetical protein
MVNLIYLLPYLCCIAASSIGCPVVFCVAEGSGYEYEYDYDYDYDTLFLPRGSTTTI